MLLVYAISTDALLRGCQEMVSIIHRSLRTLPAPEKGDGKLSAWRSENAGGPPMTQHLSLVTGTYACHISVYPEQTSFVPDKRRCDVEQRLSQCCRLHTGAEACTEARQRSGAAAERHHSTSWAGREGGGGRLPARRSDSDRVRGGGERQAELVSVSAIVST